MGSGGGWAGGSRRRRRGGRWSPPSAGLLSRWAPRLGTTTDVGITTIPDLGSLGGAMVQTVDASEPAASMFNGVASALFDGSNDFMAHSVAAALWAALHDGTGCTVYLVFDELASGSSPFVFGTHRGSATSQRGLSLASLSLGWLLRVGNGSGTGWAFSGSRLAIPAGKHVVSISVDATNGVITRDNGAAVAALTGALSSPDVGAPNDTITVGRAPAGGGNNMNINWGESLVYGVEHDAATKAAIEAGLNSVWRVF
jgi:hypothetical protein